MTVVVFTPTVLTSAIGRMTKLVARELLARGHEVAIVRTEDMTEFAAPTHEFGAETVRWDETDQVSGLVQSADIVIYQIGDNYSFHRGSLEWLPGLPGVICLHDYFLGNLFCGWSETRRPRARSILQAWYGETIADCYFDFCNSTDFVEATRDSAPMVEWVSSMATGVVTHSSWNINRVLDSCAGPVYVVPLAYNALPLGYAEATETRKDELTILTIGPVNPNKRATSVIRAIGASEYLREKARYQLIGRVDPLVAAQLTTLADSLRVKLMISGEVDDDMLRQAIEAADVMCCLRLPALEAASASTIEAMLCGKAIVVMDTGFYRELPDDCVRKIPPDEEIAGLREELEALCADPAIRLALGGRAAAWAASMFSPARYADSLLNLCWAAARAAPAISASHFFAETLTRWGASTTGLPMTDMVAPLVNIFGSGGEFPGWGSRGTIARR